MDLRNQWCIICVDFVQLHIMTITLENCMSSIQIAKSCFFYLQ